MKKLVAFFLSLLCITLPAFPQSVSLPVSATNITRSFQFTGPANDAVIYEAGSGITYHRLQWWGNGTITACNVQVDASTDGVNWTAGFVIPSQTCTAALNVYVQDSGDGTNWNDRISFTQVTTSASKQIAGITASGSLAPTAGTDGTLAAGSIVNGPIGPNMRVRWIIGGTTPSFTATIVVWCW